MLSDKESFTQTAYEHQLDQVSVFINKRRTQSSFADNICKNLFISFAINAVIAFGVFVLAIKVENGNIGFYLFLLSLIMIGSSVTCLSLSIILSVKSGKLEADAENMHLYYTLLEIDYENL